MYRSPLHGPVRPTALPVVAPRFWPPVKAERAMRYRVDAKRKGAKLWEEIGKTDDLNRALVDAVKRARLTELVTYRVWDFHGKKEVWQGCGKDAAVALWDMIRPKGLVGKNRGRARCNPGFLYAPKYRPPGLGAVPDGWTLVERPAMSGLGFDRRTDLPVSRFRYGVISYPKRLSDAEIRKWDLEDLGASPNPPHRYAPVRGRRAARRNAPGLPKGVKVVRKIGTDPFGMGTVYVEASDGNAWHLGQRVSNMGPVAAFLAQVKRGDLRVTLLPGVGANPRRRRGTRRNQPETWYKATFGGGRVFIKASSQAEAERRAEDFGRLIHRKPDAVKPSIRPLIMDGMGWHHSVQGDVWVEENPRRRRHGACGNPGHRLKCPTGTVFDPLSERCVQVFKNSGRRPRRAPGLETLMGKAGANEARRFN